MNMFEVLKNPNAIKEKDNLKEKAMEKFKKEMEESEDPYIKMIGGILIEYVGKNSVSEKILNLEKNIKGSVDEMMKVAMQRAVPICYNDKKGKGTVLSYQEGMEIILKYFEIE